MQGTKICAKKFCEALTIFQQTQNKIRAVEKLKETDSDELLCRLDQVSQELYNVVLSVHWNRYNLKEIDLIKYWPIIVETDQTVAKLLQNLKDLKEVERGTNGSNGIHYKPFSYWREIDPQPLEQSVEKFREHSNTLPPLEIWQYFCSQVKNISLAFGFGQDA